MGLRGGIRGRATSLIGQALPGETIAACARRLNIPKSTAVLIIQASKLALGPKTIPARLQEQHKKQIKNIEENEDPLPGLLDRYYALLGITTEEQRRLREEEVQQEFLNRQKKIREMAEKMVDEVLSARPASPRFKRDLRAEIEGMWELFKDNYDDLKVALKDWFDKQPWSEHPDWSFLLKELKKDLSDLQLFNTVHQPHQGIAPFLPWQDLPMEKEDGSVLKRGLVNARTLKQGDEDEEVQKLPVFVTDEIDAPMGYGYRPFVEKKFKFYKRVKYKPLPVDNDLYYELALEALFQVRSHKLLLMLKSKAMRILNGYDCRRLTSEEKYYHVLNAAAMAYLVHPSERIAKNLIKRNIVAINSTSARYRKWDSVPATSQ